MTMFNAHFLINGLWNFEDSATRPLSPAPGLTDWQARCEEALVELARERSRADEAETRFREQQAAEVDARARANQLDVLVKQKQQKLEAAEEEVRDIRRTSKEALALGDEVERLEKLLVEAGVEPRKRLLNITLRMENSQLREENRQLREEVREKQAKIEEVEAKVAALETEIADLRSTRKTLSKSVFGAKSEQQDRPPSGRKRGQQPGQPGHGRTPRPKLEEKEERHEPPPEARTCSDCGKPYVANGERSSEIIEVEVKAHIRKVVRPRYAPGCDCPDTPPVVIAPPPPRLFPNTPFGISVWSLVLRERYQYLRPCRRVAVWLSDQGLTVSPGTLADSVDRMLPLFQPLYDAILVHQNEQTLRFADETSWRVQELKAPGRSSRGWLWTSVSSDAVYFYVDPSRSAEAASRMFVDIPVPVYLVCDRYSAYKRLAKDLGMMIILCWCWAHVRRDFLKCERGDQRLTKWCDEWIERIAELYRLNAARLEHWTPGTAPQTADFETAQAALKKALDALFAQAEQELAALPETAREVKPLRSLINHREGLCVFLDHPEVPMDNNTSEGKIRNPAIGRKLSFGSDSMEGARLTSVMYTVLGTIAMNGLDVGRWLEGWLTACAEPPHGPPEDLSPWLPWSMSEERREALTAPP